MHFLNYNPKHNSILTLVPTFLFIVILSITLISVVSSFGWNAYLELFAHFKLQYFILNLLLFCWLLITRKKSFILISLFCLSIILIEILPWYIPQTKLGLNTSNQLRVLSANVNIQNQSYEKMLSLVRQEKPDIAIFMEIHEDWVNQLDSLKDILPFSLVSANSYNLGIGVYSKRPLENASFKFFGTRNNPSIVGNLNVNEQSIALVASHPLPPKPGAMFHSRNKQLDEIRQYIKSLSTRAIVAGDLNITMWSPYYKRFVSKTRLKNARQGFGLLPTWPVKTNYPPYSKIPALLTGLLSIPIDHCLISPDIQVAKIRTGANVGSDHRPLITDLVIPNDKH